VRDVRSTEPLTDTPFSKLDLISCRNLLIYIEPAVQDRLIRLLHFGLLEDGYLFLGNAETIGTLDDLFEPVSKKWRIYRRIGPTRHDKVEFPVVAALRRAVGRPHRRPFVRARAASSRRPSSFCRSLRAGVRDRHPQGEIVHFLGPRTSTWFSPRAPNAGRVRAGARRAADDAPGRGP
jgi:hypothetical protein